MNSKSDHSSAPFWIAALLIILWASYAIWRHPAQFNDSLEQYVWSHSLEFGYWKHPPLPTWILAFVIRVIGFSAYWTYALAAFFFMGTAFFSWKIAQKIFDSQVALLTVLLITLHMGFSLRAELYNHNTVLIFFISAVVWATLVALEHTKKTIWVAVGLLAGFSMLTKYQALVPLVGILLALYIGGWFKKADVRAGVAISITTASVVFSPHLVWLMHSTGSTIDNVFHSAVGLEPSQRIRDLLGFNLIQLRYHAPMLFAIVVLQLLKKPKDGAKQNKLKLDHVQRAWFIGIVGWPVLVVSLVLILGGIRLQAQWGLQSYQFLVIFIAWRLTQTAAQLKFGKIIAVVLVIHGLFAALVMWSNLASTNAVWRGSQDRNFPAKEVSQNLMREWRSVTNCKLQYVVGEVLEAASVGVHSGQNPAVLESGSFQKSPWVRPNQLQVEGGMYLAYDNAALPADLAAKGEIVIPAKNNDPSSKQILYWGIVRPQALCK